MDEHTQNNINAVTENFFARIDAEIKQAPFQALPDLSEVICNLNSLKHQLNNDNEQQRYQVTLMKNINDHIKGQGGNDGGNKNSQR